MKYFASILALLTLVACAESPATRMSPLQVASLTDAQLCQMDSYYRAEPKTMQEIGKRGINCDAAAMECMARGIPQNSPSMALCMSAVRLEWDTQAASWQEEARRNYAMYELGTPENTQHIYINR